MLQVVAAHGQRWEDNAVGWIFAAAHPYFLIWGEERAVRCHHLDHPVRVTTDILDYVYFATPQIRWSVREVD